MHPLLAEDLTKLKDEELHKKIHELTTRLTQSYRMGNYALAGQCHMLLEDYNAESIRRNQKLLDELTSKNNKFDGIIDIK
jgi:hypothetical protein